MMASARYPRVTVLVFGFMFIYIVAALFHLPALFYMAAALAVAPVVSYGVARAGLHRVRAERRIPPRLWPGESVEVEVRVYNQALLPKCLLRVDERLPAGLEGDKAEPPGCVVPMLWGEPFVHVYRLVPRKRGRYALPPVRVTAVDALDLTRAVVPSGPADETLVYPQVIPLKDVTIHQATRRGRRRRQRSLTDGTDFRSTREYVPGDDLRRVHWPSTARRGEPIVVEFEEHAVGDLLVVLDTSAAGRTGGAIDNTFETAVTLAASVIAHELERSHAVGLFMDGPLPAYLPLTRERSDLLAFLELLATVEADGARPFMAGIGAAEAVVPPGTEVLLVSGSLDPAIPFAVSGLLAGVQDVSYAFVDPSAYASNGAAAVGPFVDRLQGTGAVVYRIRPGQIERGLREPL
ncbi:MAG: DUF58 domain-containing protein [Armatimonadetes bacterium]|nr:DUF58 domain-containing protein [Armatimonadota bacterium]